MTNEAGRLAREIMAMLEADLRTSGAHTQIAILRATRTSLASLNRGDQFVIVGACPSKPNQVSVEVDGPAVVGFIALRV